jgi:hypothetical protein
VDKLAEVLSMISLKLRVFHKKALAIGFVLETILEVCDVLSHQGLDVSKSHI